jgi:hypothetical protein
LTSIPLPIPPSEPILDPLVLCGTPSPPQSPQLPGPIEDINRDDLDDLNWDLSDTVAEAEFFDQHMLVDHEDHDLKDDASKVDDNYTLPTSPLVTSDPTSIPLLTSLLTAYSSSHSVWFVRIILVVVVYLHNRYRLSHRGCVLLLFVIGSILSILNIIPTDDPVPKRLETVLSRLKLADTFDIHPICGTCHQVFPPDIPHNTSCPKCSKPLFSSAGRTIACLGTQKRPHPICVAPIRLLSTALPEFLQCGANEMACEVWRSSRVHQDIKTEVWHGDVWNSIRGPDGKLWFDRDGPSDVLNLGVTLSIDWYVYSLRTTFGA